MMDAIAAGLERRSSYHGSSCRGFLAGRETWEIGLALEEDRISRSEYDVKFLRAQ